MRTQRRSNGQFVTLTDGALIGSGGEARIYGFPQDPTLVAKIWHKPNEERARKVAAMLANPPVDPTASLRHVSIAWPVDLLQEVGTKHVIGFLMPRVSGQYPAIDFFNPKTRREKCPLFNYFYLHRTARNLAIAMRALHERGYVIGDVNESNVLVADTALVTVVDTDSFQVRDERNGLVYRCRVGKPEFTPPEMQGKVFGQLDRTAQQDYFGLGVLIFQFLMEGTHPFAGAFFGKGDAPPYEHRISSGHFPYSGDINVPYQPKPAAPPLDLVHPSLQHLFMRCFLDGHISPELRPDTTSWQWSIEEAEHALVTCAVNPQHIHGMHHSACPWCQRTKMLGGRDPFPSPENVKRGAHLAKLPQSGSGVIDPRNPPVPKPIPPSKPKIAKQTGPFSFLTHRRNDWAWLGLFFSASGWLIILILPKRWFFLAYFSSMLGALLSTVGEINSHNWDLDGRGKWPARIGILLGLLCFAVLIKGIL